MQYSLDQRRYRLDISRKQLHEECNNRGRKISYNAVCQVINEPGELLHHTEKLVIDTIEELEAEKGIVSSEF